MERDRSRTDLPPVGTTACDFYSAKLALLDEMERDLATTVVRAVRLEFMENKWGDPGHAETYRELSLRTVELLKELNEERAAARAMVEMYRRGNS